MRGWFLTFGTLAACSAPPAAAGPPKRALEPPQAAGTTPKPQVASTLSAPPKNPASSLRDVLRAQR
jgi:hypothetical protein